MDKAKKGTKKHTVRDSLQMGNDIAVSLAKARIKADRGKRKELAAVYRKCERMIEDAIEKEPAAEAVQPSASA